MIIKYNNKDVEKVCCDINESQRRFGKKISIELSKLMTILKNLDHLQSMRTNVVFKKFNIHNLIGDKKGLISIRIDYSYRMTLILEKESVGNELDEIKIMEVKNHYGD